MRPSATTNPETRKERDDMTISRQPKGTPIGGQFAANSHDEAEGSLGDSEDLFTARARLYEMAEEKARAAEQVAAFATLVARSPRGRASATVDWSGLPDADSAPQVLVDLDDGTDPESWSDEHDDTVREAIYGLVDDREMFEGFERREFVADYQDGSYRLHHDGGTLEWGSPELTPEEADAELASLTSERAAYRDLKEKATLAGEIANLGGAIGKDRFDIVLTSTHGLPHAIADAEHPKIMLPIDEETARRVQGLADAGGKLSVELGEHDQVRVSAMQTPLYAPDADPVRVSNDLNPETFGGARWSERPLFSPSE